MLLLLTPQASGGGGPNYANCVFHLRGDNAGSSTIIDEINGSSAWTFAGAASQSSTSPIAGAGSFNISNNDDTKFIRSTNAAVRAGLAFASGDEWCVRFKFRAFNWNNSYGAVLGSGPGNPVFSFSNNGQNFGISNYSWAIPGGPPALGTDHEIEISRVAGRLYAFYDGTLLNAGGNAHTESYASQAEWFICHQPHAAEFFDGWVDEVQGFKGVGGHTASYTAAINTPFPGAGAAGVACSLAVTDVADALSATAALVIVAGLAGTDAGDGLTATAAASLAASAAATDDSDTVSASAFIGAAPIDCALSVTDSGDVVVSAVIAVISAALARMDAGDIAAATAAATILATLARTDAADALASSAFVGSAPITASLAVSDTSDAVASVAALRVSAVASSVDSDDAFASAAVARLLAIVAVTDAADLLDSSASTANPVMATLAVLDASDALAATLIHPPAVRGSLIGRPRQAVGIRSSVQTSARRNVQTRKR